MSRNLVWALETGNRNSSQYKPARTLVRTGQSLILSHYYFYISANLTLLDIANQKLKYLTLVNVYGLTLGYSGKT